MDRILLAVDGSDHSERAAKVAGELSRCTGAAVEVVHVIPDRAAVTGTALHAYAQVEDVYVTQRELLVTGGEELLGRITRLVEDEGGAVKEANVAIGSPAYAIAEMAESRDVDAIVMGRRGLGDMGGLVMGSVTHKVGHLTGKTLVTTE